MREFILTLFILFQLNSYAQTKADKYNFDHTIIEVSGDLNKDRFSGCSERQLQTKDKQSVCNTISTKLSASYLLTPTVVRCLP